MITCKTAADKHWPPLIVQDRSQAPLYLLRWNGMEVKPGLQPSQFTIKNIKKRVEKKGDLFEGVLGKGINIPLALKKMDMEEISSASI